MHCRKIALTESSTFFSWKVARALIKPQKCLQKDNVQAIHDRAVAMGDSDPLKPDYSRFLRSGKKTAFSNAIPLRHGHLENYSHWRDVIGTQAVTKIQNIFRGKLARKAAESIAKKHAFFCARAVALHDTRQRITADIWKVCLFLTLFSISKKCLLSRVFFNVSDMHTTAGPACLSLFQDITRRKRSHLPARSGKQHPA